MGTGRKADEFRLAMPRSRENIRRDTYLLRKKLGLGKTLYFPILHFLENVLPTIDDTFNLVIEEDRDMPGIQAEYIPQINTIRVRQSVYDAATRGYWVARSTLAHELGHYYYHDEETVRYAKLDMTRRVPVNFDPERQATIFSANLLAPLDLIDGMDVKAVGKACGVSYTTASRQLSDLSKIKAQKYRKWKEKKKRLNQTV